MESLAAQPELNEAIQTRHRIWAKDADNANVKIAHLEIIEMIRQTREKYALLIEINTLCPE